MNFCGTWQTAGHRGRVKDSDSFTITANNNTTTACAPAPLHAQIYKDFHTLQALASRTWSSQPCYGWLHHSLRAWTENGHFSISFQGYDVTNNSTDVVNGMSEADACRIGLTVPALFMASHTDGRQRVNSGPHSDFCSMLSDPHTPSHSGQKFHMHPQ